MMYFRKKSGETADQIFILNGELRGVSVPLGDEQLHLGSSSEFDVVLLDDDAEVSGISIAPSKPGVYEISGAVGTVRVGRRSLKPGKASTASSGTSIQVGNVQMMVSNSMEEADQSLHLHRRGPKGFLWAASAVGVIAVISSLGFSGLIGSVVAKPSSFQNSHGVILTDNGVESELAARALDDRLLQVGLGPFQTVDDRQNRVVTITGKLRKSDRERWIDVVEWFDLSYGKSVYLDVKLTPVDDAVTLPFSVDAIWAGSTPRVTLHDGSRRLVGDVLPGGWLLKAITESSVTISKDEETLVVPL